LSRADLSRADLSRADLSRADLSGADLSGAYLLGADLSGAYLSGANLSRADLSCAKLSRANLDKIKHKFSILPEGDIVGYKNINGTIIQLLINSTTRRVNALSSRKCRAESALVVSINDIKTGKELTEVVGGHDSKFKYTAGEFVTPDKYNDSVLEECTNGIHFFITKQEALEY
jgi:hypothetical protein